MSAPCTSSGHSACTYTTAVSIQKSNNDKSTNSQTLSSLGGHTVRKCGEPAQVHLTNEEQRRSSSPDSNASTVDYQWLECVSDSCTTTETYNCSDIANLSDFDDEGQGETTTYPAMCPEESAKASSPHVEETRTIVIPHDDTYPGPHLKIQLYRSTSTTSFSGAEGDKPKTINKSPEESAAPPAKRQKLTGSSSSQAGEEKGYFELPHDPTYPGSSVRMPMHFLRMFGGDFQKKH